ncbi:hypothetical protein EST38_g12996 [Candolleomyces aberdarensis]|uniref:Uncharacterized protein n=1 Tax=Candolleomyces aberdarensis TaxID=2316362 RepID=A0A4V1Q1V0_9AGAR|nr:hypothetical protein EST38_g12996 [Candolleomyces aberdarensis]
MDPGHGEKGPATEHGPQHHIREEAPQDALKVNAKNGREEVKSATASCIFQDGPMELPDPRGRYTTFYNQFANLIMISTFTGGVQAAVLSFMNDLLSGEALKVQIFPVDPADPSRTLYSTFSLGLMLGLLAVALNLTVAAIAAVNAALACHFSLHLPPADHKPSMEARIVFCMLIQFMASGLAGISLVILSLSFDKAFTIVTAILFFAGIIISAYHLVALFGSQWFTKLRGQPLHTSWGTITTFGFTVTYHMLAVLHNRSSKGDRPRRLGIFGVALIAGCWVGCAIVTATLGHFREAHWHRDRAVMYLVISLASAEAAVLVAIGGYDYRVKARWEKNHPNQALSSPHDSSSSKK